jgi:hypothetical protein
MGGRVASIDGEGEMDEKAVVEEMQRLREELAECEERRKETVAMVDLLRQELTEARAALRETFHDPLCMRSVGGKCDCWVSRHAAAIEAAEDKP